MSACEVAIIVERGVPCPKLHSLTLPLWQSQ
jgi:hypothetical protein